MPKSELEKYKANVASQLSRLSPFLQKFAMGDFSKSIKIPEEENEFSELFISLNLIGDNIKKLIKEKDHTLTKSQQLINERDRILNMPCDLICIAGTDGYFKYLNFAWEKTLGYTREELLSRPFLDFIHPDDHKKNDTEVEKLSRGEQTINFENRYIHKDGSFRTISWTATPLEKEKQMYCIGRDITECKQLEEELSLQRERLQFLFSAGSVVIYTSKASGDFGATFISDNIRKQMDYTPEDFINDPNFWVNHIHPEDRDRVLAGLSDIVEKRHHIHEYRFAVSDGTYHWMRDEFTLIQDDKGNPLECLGCWIDITDKKQAEEELNESLQREQFLANIVRNASVGVAIGYPDGRLGLSNAAYQKITGYSDKELQTIDWNKILTPPEWEESETAKLQELHRTRKSVQYEKEYIKKDGSRVPVELIVHPRFGSDGNVECYFTFVIDITDRKKVEQRLKHLINVLKAIRNVNQLITKEKDPDKLVAGACKHLVETRGYFNVWISLFDEKQKSVTGKSLSKEFSSVKKMLKEGKRVQCQKMVLKKEGVLVIENPSRTCKDCPLSSEYEGRAAMIKRLEHNGTLYGTITVSLQKFMAGDDEEQRLFNELANDISYGLFNIDVEERQKKAEEELRISQDLYFLILDNLPNPVIGINKDTSIDYINPALKKLTGFSSEELVGKKAPYPFWSKAKQKMILGDLKTAMKKGAKGLQELFQDKNGNTFWVEITSFPIIRGGDLKYYIANWVDITERKKTEDKLRKMKDELEVKVEEKTRDLQKRLDELERFHDATVDRELRMKELRDEIERLKKRLKITAWKG